MSERLLVDRLGRGDADRPWNRAHGRDRCAGASAAARCDRRRSAMIAASARVRWRAALGRAARSTQSSRRAPGRSESRQDRDRNMAQVSDAVGDRTTPHQCAGIRKSDRRSSSSAPRHRPPRGRAPLSPAGRERRPTSPDRRHRALGGDERPSYPCLIHDLSTHRAYVRKSATTEGPRPRPFRRVVSRGPAKPDRGRRRNDVDRRPASIYKTRSPAAAGTVRPGNAQPPLPPMLMLLTASSRSPRPAAPPASVWCAEFDIRPDLWFFLPLPGRPVMPGCRASQRAVAADRLLLGWLGLPGRGRALGVGRREAVSDQVPPTTKLVEYRVETSVFKTAQDGHRRRHASGRRQADLRGHDYARRPVPGLTSAEPATRRPVSPMVSVTRARLAWRAASPRR